MKNLNRRHFLGYSMAASSGLVLPRFSMADMATDLSGGIDQKRELVLAERPQTPAMRDAVNVWIEEENAAFAMRIGVEALAEKWDNQLVWLDIGFPDGRVLNLRDENGKTHSALGKDGRPTVRGSGGVRFQCLDPFRHWQVTFSGRMPESTATELIQQVWPDKPVMTDVEFDIHMHMAVPPWMPGSMLKDDDKAAFEGEQGEFISPRYEQLFRCYGTMRIGKDVYNFSGPGLRIRRTGVRKLRGFWGHCWQSAVFPGGKAFGFNTFPPKGDGTPTYNEGYVFDGSGVLKPARAIKIPWLTELNPAGDDVSCTLETEDGIVSIEGATFINLRSRVPKGLTPPGFPVVQQAHARYRWDGEDTVGMIERSSLPEVFTSKV